MHDGFDITFREVIPESAMVELVVAEFGKLRAHAGVHCSVVVSRLESDQRRFKVHVELSTPRHDPELHGQAVGRDQFEALRKAFAVLRRAEADQPNEAEHPPAGSGRLHAVH